MDLSAFHNQFRDETLENVRVLNEGLLAIETIELGAAERRQWLDAIFRAMHTIKGSARLLDFEPIGRLAHTCEHILGAVREGRRELDRALADDLLRGGDAILELTSASIEGRAPTIDVESLTLTLGRSNRSPASPAADPPAAAPEPATAPPARPQRSAARQTIRVRVDRLDRLLNLTGELAVGRQTQAAHLHTLDELTGLVAQQERALLALERELKQLRFSAMQRDTIDRHLNSALNAGDRASRLIHTHAERFGQHLNHTNLLIEDLEQEVMAARLMPIATAFANLPRAVRELAYETGKEISLVLTGEATELDRKIIEALSDPLVHLIRNAVDHGIEPPEDRERLGKPRQGTIQVEAEAFGALVYVRIRDDGYGIDTARLREAAIRKNLYTPEQAAALTEQEVLDLVFLPGFSTAQIITDISGRGVGMDVVRTNIVELGGQVQVESRLQAGTTITLILPITLMTTRVLLVEAAGQLFALPASGCQGSTWVYAERLKTIEGRAMLQHEGRMAPLLRLADLLGIGGERPFPAHQRRPAVLIGGQRALAVLVDRLIDEREVVVKPLGPLFEKQRHFNGAVQLGNGRLILLINPVALTQLARSLAVSAPPIARPAPARHSRLLVADDSFTTRELIRSILQSAGYHVTTAVDGFDALDKLRSDTYDLVVSDIEMPRVDGFQLTSKIRTDLGLADLPVIIITSLASETHRRRGLEAGAQAYIVKSQFNQHSLLETIQQLLA